MGFFMFRHCRRIERPCPHYWALNLNREHHSIQHGNWLKICKTTLLGLSLSNDTSRLLFAPPRWHILGSGVLGFMTLIRKILLGNVVRSHRPQQLWQLGNVARYAPRLFESQSVSNLRVAHVA